MRRVIQGISLFRKKNVAGSGQVISTCIRDLYDRFQAKVLLAVARYRAAYQCLCAIDPAGDWSTRLQTLKDEHVSGPGLEADEERLGEGRRELSWIWRYRGAINPLFTDSSNQEIDDSMRVEWGKCRARAHRWTEETILLQEEMRRVIAFFEWKAQWWRNQAQKRTASSSLVSGLVAYAEKQAWILEKRAQYFAAKWIPLLKKYRITPEWAEGYKDVQETVTGSNDEDL